MYVQSPNGSLYVTVVDEAGTSQTVNNPKEFDIDFLIFADENGTIAAGYKTLIMKNTGGVNVSIGSGTLTPGESISFNVEGDNTLGSITYDCAGGSLSVVTVG